jgi:geranylgeranyl diphosphate synthase type II
MIGGQVADLEAERSQERSTDVEALRDELAFIHANKTGRLLTASVVLGGLLANASAASVDALRNYGRAIGLAFQIVDDLLDIEESSETLGKTAGKDVAQGKLTYPALYGIDVAREKAAALLAEAETNAGMIAGPVNYLPEIARYICERRS